eukprot:CCRYP_015833-RC/>CCRYP_015833-RC protein AED:0.20 eAED:0.20 QI:1467/0.6/0.66/1/0/0/6/0/247
MAGSNATVWCCVMTFYRVAVFSYRATVSYGKVLLNDENRRRWIQSQDFSIQFQVAHDVGVRGPASKEYQRVEKVLSSSQASITGVAPASSLNDYSSYLGILPSSSTVFSASSAMSQLGSQMKPLLGTMRAAASGGGTNPNILVSHHLRVATISKQWQHPLVIYGKVDQVPYKFALPMGADEALNTYAFPGRTNLGYLIQFESRRGEVMACCSAAQGMTANLLPRRQFLVHRGCFFLWMNSIDRGSFF